MLIKKLASLFKANETKFLLSKIKPQMFSTTANIKEEKLTLNDGKLINFLKVGEGNQVLVLCPGAVGTIWSDFKPQIDAFDRNKFTIVAWDPPGYGNSRPPNRKFTVKFYEDDADATREFLNKLGFKKYSLLGWSDGGISSLIAAAKYPDEVEKLVVWGSNAYVLPEEIETYEKIRNIENWSKRMSEPLIEMYGREGFQELWSGWCDALKAIHEAGGNICKDILPKIKCPTLVIHGDKDVMVAPEHPQYLLKHIKGSRYYSFPDGKHNLHLKYAKEFNELVAKFLLNDILT